MENLSRTRVLVSIIQCIVYSPQGREAVAEEITQRIDDQNDSTVQGAFELIQIQAKKHDREDAKRVQHRNTAADETTLLADNAPNHLAQHDCLPFESTTVLAGPSAILRKVPHLAHDHFARFEGVLLPRSLR